MQITQTDFTRLSEEGLREVLKWRNNPSVREVSRDNSAIAWEAHIEFARNLAGNAAKKYYKIAIADRENFGGGVIFFTNIDGKKAEMGLYKDFNSSVKNMGAILMNIIFIKVRELGLIELTLCALKTNKIARELYAKFGFELDREEENLVYMRCDLRNKF
ncbi:MAG: hypothetical protein LBU73_04240 [Helicobacteraceae bacterium]|jgi:UDP-4-amino-4,6-dideoxy-N-acetyl-beta-L-altrosamine N-acetyltransferase|nr:hypothetical protein [Helicobacteraceae bacterium]